MIQVSIGTSRRTSCTCNPALHFFLKQMAMEGQRMWTGMLVSDGHVQVSTQLPAMDTQPEALQDCWKVAWSWADSFWNACFDRCSALARLLVHTPLACAAACLHLMQGALVSPAADQRGTSHRNYNMLVEVRSVQAGSEGPEERSGHAAAARSLPSRCAAMPCHMMPVARVMQASCWPHKSLHSSLLLAQAR